MQENELLDDILDFARDGVKSLSRTEKVSFYLIFIVTLIVFQVNYVSYFDAQPTRYWYKVMHVLD